MSWKFIRYAVYLPVALLIMSCAPGKYEIAFPQQQPPGGTPSLGAPSYNLTGQWTSSQFQCPLGTRYTETVKVEQRGQQLSAVKITGDPCVPAGYKSFQGTLSGGRGQLRCFVAGGNEVPGTLRVIDANSFDACGMRFVRSGAYPAPGPVAPPTPGAPSATLQQPTFRWNDSAREFTFWVNGQIRNAYGANAQLILHFTYDPAHNGNWIPLNAHPSYPQFRSSKGKVQASRVFSVPSNPYNLGALSLKIPYAAFNLVNTGGVTLYKLNAKAWLSVRGSFVAVSPPVDFTLKW